MVGSYANSLLPYRDGGSPAYTQVHLQSDSSGLPSHPSGYRVLKPEEIFSLPAPAFAEFSGPLNEELDRRSDLQVGRVYIWHTGNTIRGKFNIGMSVYLFQVATDTLDGSVLTEKEEVIGTAQLWRMPKFTKNSPDFRARLHVDGNTYRGSLMRRDA